MWPPTHLRVVEGKPKRRNASPEADLQEAVVKYLELALPPSAGVWWSASMSGVRLPSAAAKAKAKRQGLRPGMPDLCFIPLWGENHGETFWIELKAAKGQLSVEQTALMASLFPNRGAVARSVEQVSAALVAFGFPVRARL